MRFMVLVKATRESEAGVLPSENMLAEMARFNEELVKAGVMLAGPFSALPLVACGVLKIGYDLALLAMFRHTKPPEEM